LVLSRNCVAELPLASDQAGTMITGAAWKRPAAVQTIGKTFVGA